ncbi:MAG: hypothetical protein ACYTE3_28325 [Planctomycetota bacterium]
MMATIVEYINPLLKGENLSFEQATSLLDVVFDGEVPEPQIAAFLTAMRIKGPTAQEVAGLARSLRSHAVKVEAGVDNLVDVVGTGGAAVKTFNVSTAGARRQARQSCDHQQVRLCRPARGTRRQDRPGP